MTHQRLAGKVVLITWVADVRDRGSARSARPSRATGSTSALIPGKLDNAAKGSGGLGYVWAKRALAKLRPQPPQF